MPKENKHSRGKRGEKAKRKRDEAEDSDGPTKRQKPIDAEMEDVQLTGAGDTEFLPANSEAPEMTERPFFGLLEDEEQEYFRRADELLEANDFEDEEQRQLFLTQVYHEAEGKELKIANSQSCSRLMERLILLSTPVQKKRLFEKFRGNFLHLIQHRFASHCCETLFAQSASIVTAELIGDSTRLGITRGGSSEDEAVLPSMEDSFLLTLDELEGYMTFLLTNRFASHALRVLLVVLSGKTLEGMTKSLLYSKKKERITVHGKKSDSEENSLTKRAIPESFRFAMDKIISDTVASMDSSFIRVLATHPMGNPTLQLLLELELTQQGKKKGKEENSVIRRLLPDDLSAPDSEGVSFINGLIYDSVGSRLLETIVTFAPGKLFKQIYRISFKDRMGSLARNETAGFVVIKVLERLSLEDLNDAITSILPQIPSLVERSKTSIIKTIIERCVARGADITELAKTLKTCYGEDPTGRISKMVNLGPTIDADAKPDENGRTFTQLHGSLLAQTMLNIPGPLAELIQDSLLAQSSDVLLRMSKEIFTSHIIQAAVVPTRANIPFRRKLINKLLPSIQDLAIHTNGSHVIDALWMGTEGIMNLKERIALSLQEQETSLRDSYEGRKIWRNWMMDLFKRQRKDWIAKVKEGAGGAPVAKSRDIPIAWDAFHPLPETKKMKKDKRDKSNKMGIEIAREKYWLEKDKKGEKSNSVMATGANMV